MRPVFMTRREALARAGLLASAALVAPVAAQAAEAAVETTGTGAEAFRFCLNTSTLRGQKLGIVKELEVASKAGYSGVEPWVEEVQAYAGGGGDLNELRRRISDVGLTVEGAIGFPEWLVNDDERRAKGMDRAKREMELIAQIGGKRIAAPASGATNLPKIEVAQAAERYRALLEAGDQIGIVPELELWGFSKNLNPLGECVAIAMETGHPKACVLADVFHMYKGGSNYRGLVLLGPNTVQVLHMNDYPAEPPREKIDDSYRDYPGNGVAPLAEMLRCLRQPGGQKVLSLELFNRKYWAQDPLEVTRTGLEKMKAVAARA
jgi:2-keto-myo-inositol isomerase